MNDEPNQNPAAAEIPLPGMAGDAPPVPPSIPVPPPRAKDGRAGNGGAREGAGRKPKLEKLAEAMRRRGLLPDAPPAPSAAPVEARAAPAPAFDAEAARAFVVTLLDAADEFNAEKVEGLVAAALNDKALAAQFRAKAAFAPAMKRLAVDDCVELLRANNVTIGPGARLAVAVFQIGSQQIALRKEIRALAHHKPA